MATTWLWGRRDFQIGYGSAVSPMPSPESGEALWPLGLMAGGGQRLPAKTQTLPSYLACRCVLCLLWAREGPSLIRRSSHCATCQARLWSSDDPFLSPPVSSSLSASVWSVGTGGTQITRVPSSCFSEAATSL